MLKKNPTCSIIRVKIAYHITHMLPDETGLQRPKGRWFKVPAVLLDRAIYPESLGVSNDAFRLLIYLCSAIRMPYGATRAGSTAAKKYLGFNEARYRAALRELQNAQLIFQLPPKPKKGQTKGECRPKKHETKYWSIANPPLVYIDRTKPGWGLHQPDAEPKTGRDAIFHRRKTLFEFIRVPHEFVGEFPNGLLTQMSIAEIDCYFNLLWQHREHWSGVDPHFVRYELPSKSALEGDTMALEQFLQPSGHCDRLWVSPVLQERTQRSADEVRKTITDLIVTYGLFRPQLWAGVQITYEEQRRSRSTDHVRLRYFIDSSSASSVWQELACLNLPIGQFTLIAQLRSCLRFDDEYERLCDRNCGTHTYMDHLLSGY